MTVMAIIALSIWSFVGIAQGFCLIFQLALLGEQHKRILVAKDRLSDLRNKL
ncbi:hypothetical protein [Sporosarcina sp. P17b]|uniref:hypothetical protein n=1 Tax=Sporosarcina sp. P17b TaxID=2048260 RepID=UPI0013047655|nr:hypothetical protein [Sporosarcina sp. P17b]